MERLYPQIDTSDNRQIIILVGGLAAGVLALSALAGCSGETTAPPQPTDASSPATEDQGEPCNKRQSLVIDGKSYGNIQECKFPGSNLFYVKYDDQGPEDGYCVRVFAYSGLEGGGYFPLTGNVDYRKLDFTADSQPTPTRTTPEDTDVVPLDCNQGSPTVFYYTFRPGDTPGNIVLYREDPENGDLAGLVTACTSPFARPTKPPESQDVGVCKAYQQR